MLASLFVLAAACAAFADASERGAPGLQIYDLQETVGASQSAYRVEQLPDGRLLAITQGGPILFDGARWTVLHHPQMIAAGNYAVSASGRIYVGFAGDIGYFDEPVRSSWRWNSMRDRLPKDRGIDPAKFILVSEDESEHWFFFPNWMARLDKNGTIVTADTRDRIQNVWRLDGQTWLQLADGTLYQVDSSLKLTEIEGSKTALGADANGHGVQIRGISRGNDDDWRLLLADGRLLKYHDAHFSVWASAATPIIRKQLPQFMLRLRDGGYLISTRVGALIVGENGNLVSALGGGDGIPVRSTHGSFQDRQGGVWLAQDLSLVRIDLGSGVSALGESQGLPGGVVDIARWKNQLYAATTTGVYRLVAGSDGATARFERAHAGLSNAHSIVPAGDVLLVGSNGLHELTIGPAGTEEREILAVSYSFSLSASRYVQGRYWMTHSEGVTRIDRSSTGDYTFTSLPSVDWPVRALVEEDADTYWLAANSEQLWKVTNGGKTMARRLDAGNGVPDGNIRVWNRQDGTVWFGTNQGVMRYNRDTDRLESVAELPQSFRDQRIFALYEDPAGNVWARGNDLRDAIAWKRGDHYEEDASVLSAVSNKPTIYNFMRENDIVWVMRTTGLLRIDLATRAALLPASTPTISAILNSGSGQPLGLDSLVEAPSDAGNFTFRFGTPDLHRPEAMQFRTRLSGLNAAFSSWSSLAERTYTNLPPGNFSLELQSQDGYGRISDSAPLPFAIATPWYLRKSAMAAYMVGALAVLWLAFRMGNRRRQSQLLSRQRELEALVEQRTGELRSSNQQLAEQAERLTEVDRLKTRFFINVGHEFRTPLTLVLGPIDDLLRDARERFSAHAREQLEMVHRNARRVLDLIVELLDVNRFEHGQMRLTLATSDLSALAERSLEDNRQILERFGHHAELRIDGPGPWLASVDPTQIERCLGNLLGNAAKYMARGGLVTLVVCRTENSIELSIADQGRGIAQPAMPHVFDRFFQTEGNDSASGYGIGLALVREIIEAHHGQVSVESAPGLGSTFTLRVPALSNANFVAISAQSLAPDDTMDSAAELDPFAIANSSRLPLVLIVDDHDDLRAHARRLLSDRYEVIEAADGPCAWNLARDRLPDLIVCDVMMPGFDGVELTRRLRADPDTAAIAILLLTAKAGSEHAVTGLGAGADDYLAKPFDASELLARIGALLARAHRLRLRLIREHEHKTPVEAGAQTPEQRWRQKLDAAIAEHMDQSEFGIEALAREMHADRSQLFRKCKDLLGVSPSEYLRDERLRRGHTLLEQRAGNVSEVAYAVGFDSLSSFTRAFKTRYGYPPSQVAAVRKVV